MFCQVYVNFIINAYYFTFNSNRIIATANRRFPGTEIIHLNGLV